MHRAIQKVRGAGIKTSSDGYGYRSAHRPIAVAAAERSLHGSTGKRDEIRCLAAIERQFEDARIFDDLADPRASRFYKSRIRLNLDLLADLTHLQRSVDHQVVVDPQHESRLHIGLKPRQRRL